MKDEIFKFFQRVRVRVKETETEGREKKKEKTSEKVCLDNDVSELDILGHIGRFWDNSRKPFEELEHLACFSSHFLHVHPLSAYRKTCDRRTIRQTDPLMEMHAKEGIEMWMRRKKKWEKGGKERTSLYTRLNSRV